MEKNIQEELLSLLEDRINALGFTKDEISLDDSLLDQGILDSLSFLEYITKIEEYYQIDLDFSDLDPSEFTSILNIKKMIRNGI